METVFGILHDSYTDDNGDKIDYTEKVVGVIDSDDKTVNCVTIPDFMTFQLGKEEFLSKVTDLKKWE